MMNSTKEEQPREGCSCGGVLGEELLRLCGSRSDLSLRLRPPLLSTAVAIPIYRGPGPLPKYLSGKGANNGHFEEEHLVQAILTKVGLRLPKALAMAPSWAPW